MKSKILFMFSVGIILLVFVGYMDRGKARADVDVIPPLPPFMLPAPPSVILIPGTYSYFVPDIDVDILFYQGYWWRPYKKYWYRAGGYNGPWIYIAPAKVPVVLFNLPPDFRHVPPGHQRIPYGQLKKNWRTWEREKYWDKREGKEWGEKEKLEHGRDRGRGRGRRD